MYFANAFSRTVYSSPLPIRILARVSSSGRITIKNVTLTNAQKIPWTVF